MAERQAVPCADVRPASRDLFVRVVVLEHDTFTSRQNELVARCRVADASGSMWLTLFGDAARLLRPGDVVEVEGASAKQHRGALTLTVGRGGTVRRVSECDMLFSDRLVPAAVVP